MIAKHQTKGFPFLQGGGEMGELIRNHIWAQTSIGTPDRWPQALQISLGNVLNSGFPMFLFWGEELICFYNDAFRPSLGTEGKHPAVGKKGKEVWAEIWDFIGPLIDGVMKTGKPVWFEDQLVPFYRNGRLEDIYWTFSYSLILDNDGMPGGVLVTCMETTQAVKTRRNTEEKAQSLRNIIFQAPIAICIFRGAQFVVEIANDAMFEFWGKSSDQVLGKPLFEGIPEAKSQGYEELMRDVLLSGKPYSANELPVTLPRNGVVETVYINFTYHPLREDDGAVTGIMAMATDVTEQVITRQKIEDAKKEAERQKRVYETITSNTPDLMYVFGLDYRFTYVNRALLDMWGKTWEAAIGKSLLENGYEPWHAEMHEREIDQIVATKKPVRGEVSFPHATLGERVYDYILVPVIGLDGAVEAVAGTTRDITDFKQAEKAIKESEQNLQRMILQSPVAMCILLGPEHTVDVANEAMIQLWGKPVEAVVQKPIFEGLPEARNQGLETMLDTVYASGESCKAYEQPVELIRNGERETVYQNFVYEPYRDASGNVIGVMAVTIDVTAEVLARKRIEEVVAQRTTELAAANASLLRINKELQRSNQNLEEFAHAASHDLKEPVRKIHFFTDQLKSQLAPHLQEAELRSFNRIEKASQRMGNLIDDLLLYSHVSQRPHQMETVDLNLLLQNVLEDLDLDIEEKKAKVQVDRLPVIRGYRRQLQQLFQNLLSNAIKYSKDGVPPRIEITAEENNEATQRSVLIAVKDNGIGFDQEHAEKIFGMFTRLHGKGEFSGTGVGLSIAKKVVENHGGIITAESTVGKGSIFKIYLPF